LEAFDPTRGYAGAAPGQDLARVIHRLTLGDLELIIGPRVVPLLPQPSDRATLEAAATRMLNDHLADFLSHAELRFTLLRNLDPGKREELGVRLRVAGKTIESLQQPTFPTDTALRRVVIGFFGLEAPEAAPRKRVPPTQQIDALFSLFLHQRDVADRAYAKIGRGSNRVVIHMPTGSGKTRTAMHVVSRILTEHEPSVVVWLAASRELLEQAAETFQDAWSMLGNRPTCVHRLWGDYDLDLDEVTDGLLVAGLAKLFAYRNREPSRLFRLSARARLIVMDEAHQAIAPTYGGLIEGLAETGQYDAVMGLTATPGRTWNDVSSDEALSDFFGGAKIALAVEGYDNPVAYLLTEGYLARPTFRLIEYIPELEPTTEELESLNRLDEFSHEALEKLATDTARNRAIIKAALELVERGHRRIILFGISIEHAHDLAAALAARSLASPVVSNETPLSRREAILRAFKRPGRDPMIVCNYGVLTTGFDAPLTSAAIIARPTKSLVLYSQMVGRATRGPRVGGNETCEILTVLDPSYPGFGNIVEAFFNWEDVWRGKRG
jgi:DNA repair protein RadD